jgi:transposase
MSMYPHHLGPIPEETIRVARAACPKGTLAMRLRDELGGIYRDEAFSHLFSSRGQPAEAPWRLALVSVLQYVEGMTDRQAAEAVRSRIDWKYALSLPLEDPGFDASVLAEFRDRLVQGQAERILLEVLLDLCKQRGWLKGGGKQRTDSTHVLASVRSLSQLETVGETLRAALEDLAEADPDWLVAHISAQWLERYGPRVDNYRLPKAESERKALAEQVGADGWQVLQALKEPGTPDILRSLPHVQMLEQVWQQYYDLSGGYPKWRAGPQAEAKGGVIRSPYDSEARTSKKRNRIWLGYKVHLTETCEADLPHLVVAVQTTPATVTDVEMTEPIQQDLAGRDLQPEVHLVDTGYVDADLLVRSQAKGIRLLGPALPDNSWQTKGEHSLSMRQFHLDWSTHQALCPQGQFSHRWNYLEERGIWEIVFAKETCVGCPLRQQCTKARTTGRVLHVRPQAAHEALLDRRAEQETEAFRQEYHTRAGIEGTLSQGVRRCGLRQARYRGLRKTQVQEVLAAVALNVLRLDAFWSGYTPLASRPSHFQRLADRFPAARTAG